MMPWCKLIVSSTFFFVAGFGTVTWRLLILADLRMLRWTTIPHLRYHDSDNPFCNQFPYSYTLGPINHLISERGNAIA